MAQPKRNKAEHHKVIFLTHFSGLLMHTQAAHTGICIQALTFRHMLLLPHTECPLSFIPSPLQTNQWYYSDLNKEASETRIDKESVHSKKISRRLII